MIKIVRGIIVPVSIVFAFLLLAACSTDGIFAKKEKVNQKNAAQINTTEREEYIYDDEELNGSDQEARFGSSDRSGNMRNEGIAGAKDYDSGENDNYYQKGYASWYGREFDGRKTASGERYDMNKLTAAHRTLPFGTKILVKNLENDKTVTVTVNDRGPYRDNRILDVSYAAARKLGIVSSGEANVGIIIAGKESESKLVGKQSRKKDNINPVAGINRDEEENGDDFRENISGSDSYSVQAGAFYSRRNAEKLQKRLEELTQNPVILMKDNDLYKVKINSLNSKKDANKIKRMLDREEIPSYIIDNQR